MIASTPALPSSSPHAPALVLYADGGTIGGSPGRAVYWTVVGTETGLERRLRDTSGRRRWSDEAEFLALLEALKVALGKARVGDVVQIFMDCRPVLQHVRTRHAPRSDRLRELYEEVVGLLGQLTRRGIEIALAWVRRKEMVQVVGH